MLEETGLAYEPHLVDIATDDQKTPEFLSLNPNGKIPAIIDPDGPGGKPLALFESGAILIYLAEKTGQFLPADPAGALRDDPMADVPDGRRRADVRPGRLLPQVRRQEIRGQASARPLCRRGEAAAAACWTAGWRGASGSWGRLHHRRHRDFAWVRNLIGFYEARAAGRLGRVRQRRGLAVERLWRGRRSSAGWVIPKRD